MNVCVYHIEMSSQSRKSSPTKKLTKRAKPFLKQLLDSRNLMEVPYQFVNNHGYAFYTVETEMVGRKVYDNISIVMGYYQPTEDEDVIELTNAIQIEYTERGGDTNTALKTPFATIIKQKKQHYTIEEYDSVLIYPDEYESVYRIPKKRFELNYLPELKTYMEELRYAPLDTQVSFVGEKYREAKNKFEEKRRTMKRTGGKRRTRKCRK